MLKLFEFYILNFEKFRLLRQLKSCNKEEKFVWWYFESWFIDKGCVIIIENRVDHFLFRGQSIWPCRSKVISGKLAHKFKEVAKKRTT